MGLDWNVINKPKPGKEARFEEIFLLLNMEKDPRTSFFDKILGKAKAMMQNLNEEFFEISIEPYVTLGAPRVGYDDEATEWMKGNYENRSDQNLSMEEFLKECHGYYVVDLVPENDGIPNYIAMHGERTTFRAAFLKIECKDIIGEEMLGEAFQSKNAKDALDYGHRLMKIAENFAQQHGLEDVKNHKQGPQEGGHESDQVHILFAAAKWLIWWAERGHGYEADF